ncbi:uncharacterized protein EI90DRAFT_3012469 [Cantharellus anzutake]|uniref:uncharacterized protein n=1 Tax=Cantharellus anzutake TaxID=1750568 RepID=UPI0019048BDA|nr:uncharacterized protein EI90DRAFT_3012469 [Cantharellus anzutake]KAF8340682.1 hypothetical protein EI90DRAFT_3012469 [Cantharellus anzutake]
MDLGRRSFMDTIACPSGHGIRSFGRSNFHFVPLAPLHPIPTTRSLTKVCQLGGTPLPHCHTDYWKGPREVHHGNLHSHRRPHRQRLPDPDHVHRLHPYGVGWDSFGLDHVHVQADQAGLEQDDRDIAEKGVQDGAEEDHINHVSNEDESDGIDPLVREAVLQAHRVRPQALQLNDEGLLVRLVLDEHWDEDGGAKDEGGEAKLARGMDYDGLLEDHRSLRDQGLDGMTVTKNQFRDEDASHRERRE